MFVRLKESCRRILRCCGVGLFISIPLSAGDADDEALIRAVYGRDAEGAIAAFTERGGNPDRRYVILRGKGGRISSVRPAGGREGETAFELAVDRGWYDAGGKKRDAFKAMAERERASWPSRMGSREWPKGERKQGCMTEQFPLTFVYYKVRTSSGEQVGRELVKRLIEDADNRLLLEALTEEPGVDINAKNDEFAGNTPLHAAAATSFPMKGAWQRAVTERLLARGAALDAKRASDNKTVLEVAEAEGDAGTKAYFRSAAARQLGMQLVDALVNDAGNKERIEDLVNNPMLYVNVINPVVYGDTPLHAIAVTSFISKGDWQRAVTDKLLARGADLLATRSVDGKTVLEAAAAEGDEKTKTYFRDAAQKAGMVTGAAPQGKGAGSGTGTTSSDEEI